MENKRLTKACINAVDKFLEKLESSDNEFGYDVAYKTIYSTKNGTKGYIKSLESALVNYKLLTQDNLPEDLFNSLVYYRLVVRFNNAAKRKNIQKKVNGENITLSYDNEFEDAFSEMNDAWARHNSDIKLVDERGRQYQVNEFFRQSEKDSEQLKEFEIISTLVSMAVGFVIEKVAVSAIKSSPKACSWVSEQAQKHPIATKIVDFLTWTDVDDIIQKDKEYKGELSTASETDGTDNSESNESGYYYDPQNNSYYYYDENGQGNSDYQGQEQQQPDEYGYDEVFDENGN